MLVVVQIEVVVVVVPQMGEVVVRVVRRLEAPLVVSAADFAKE